MKKTNPLRHLYWPFLTARSIALSKMIAPHIKSSSKILDIGTGNMLIAKSLKERKDIKVQGLDVIDMNLTNLPHKLFDGEVIPFPNKSFDTSLLIGVLHHVDKQKKLLKEAMRVTESEIIIFEDTYKTNFGKGWLKIRDVVGNIPEEPNMNFALNFRTVEKWVTLFDELGLEINYNKTFFNPIRLTHHTIFVVSSKTTL
jgi:SAM-dependent methyltransferase